MAVRGPFPPRVPEPGRRPDRLSAAHQGTTPANRRHPAGSQLERRLAERLIQLEVTDAAKDLLAEEGFDAVYGARPLKRVIQKRLTDALAMKLLAGEYSEGDTITVDAHDGEIVFGQPVLRA